MSATTIDLRGLGPHAVSTTLCHAINLHVRGLTPVAPRSPGIFDWADANGEPMLYLPDYAASMDALMPWLEPYAWCAEHRPTAPSYGDSVCKVYAWIDDVDDEVAGYGPTLPFAACVFLLKAKGVTVHYR